MKSHLLLSTLGLSVAIALSGASNANAFFGMLGGCGCEPSCGCSDNCCEPACGCADDCCEPSCGCADNCCDPCCNSCCKKKKRCGLFARCKARRAAKHCCCEPSCGCCEASCGCADDCCEPACGCADDCCEPSCGCADNCCDPCCDCCCKKKKRCGLFARCKARRAAKRCCEPSCGCCEASCGCADSCCEAQLRLCRQLLRAELRLRWLIGQAENVGRPRPQDAKFSTAPCLVCKEPFFHAPRNA